MSGNENHTTAILVKDVFTGHFWLFTASSVFLMRARQHCAAAKKEAERLLNK